MGAGKVHIPGHRCPGGIGVLARERPFFMPRRRRWRLTGKRTQGPALGGGKVHIPRHRCPGGVRATGA